MSDPRPVDQPQNDELRARLQAWLNQQNQMLLEEVMAAWQHALGQFHPSDALVTELRESAGLSPVSFSAPETPDLALATALDLLESATGQSDLLKRLLDTLGSMAERSALFILKQGLASLYIQRGFEAGAPLKPGAVVPPPELEALIQGSARGLRQKGPGYQALLEPLSTFEAADLAIFPLLHKKKAVALVLIDSGLRQHLDHPHQARALVHAASALLGALAATREEEPRTLPGHDSQPSAPTQMVPEPIEKPAPVELDPRTRAAAERLARVLVGDVELYFPAKVAQARAQGNLYGLLRDELDRSRATFVERFGEDTEVQHRIFTSAVVQLLCDGQPPKLGAAPWA
jgi:hypothetical protein